MVDKVPVQSSADTAVQCGKQPPPSVAETGTEEQQCKQQAPRNPEHPRIAPGNDVVKQDLDEESGQEPNACVDRAQEYRLREVRLLGLQVMRDPAPPWDLRASHDTVGGLEEKDRLRHPQLLELRAREDLACHSRIHDPDAIR